MKTIIIHFQLQFFEWESVQCYLSYKKNEDISSKSQTCLQGPLNEPRKTLFYKPGDLYTKVILC